jgi:hypothetical protein
MSLPDRLEKRINRDASGCWLWTGATAKNGYGWLHKTPAHRLVYETATGTYIPAGMDLDHLCRVRNCVNPEHLEPVTRSENLRRGMGAEMLRQRFRAQTHCRHGHEFTPGNTYINMKGHRCCRECARLRINPNSARRKPLRGVLATEVISIPHRQRLSVCGHCGAPEYVVSGDYLRALRLRAGLSLREAARRLDLSAAYVSDIERNSRTPATQMVAFYEGLAR